MSLYVFTGSVHRQGRFSLLGILNSPPEGTELGCLADIKHVVVQDSGEIKEAVVDLHILVANQILDGIQTGIRGRSLKHNANTMVCLHVLDDLRSHRQILIRNIINAVVGIILRCTAEAQQEIHQIVHAAEMESVLTGTINKL